MSQNIKSTSRLSKSQLRTTWRVGRPGFVSPGGLRTTVGFEKVESPLGMAFGGWVKGPMMVGRRVWGGAKLGFHQVASRQILSISWILGGTKRSLTTLTFPKM